MMASVLKTFSGKHRRGSNEINIELFSIRRYSLPPGY